ncbi:hypothetical protein G9F72_019230 [Clostridium estertheticum]|uniref:hypothetical protein n=1 Tax=Clostridium estertheticum TaxID=238834 RepID=UPI0013E99D0E|nr:hypothetical protein [Clostridium estertheticum]MBZ9688466.1 hypothetical protein [Clostridium estertheticum]
MKLSSADIINKVNAEFSSVYKPFSKFPNSGLIWDECINTIKDAKLVNNIIFCNDILQIPPVKVFIMANDLLNFDLTDSDKKAIGAFWGFIFKFAFDYKNQKSISVRVNNVKSATYFFDSSHNVEVEN